jgi:hypothetical protein
MSRYARPIAIGAAVVAGVALGAWLAGRGGSSSSSTPQTIMTTRPATKVDAAGAFLTAGRSGNTLVGLAARPGGPVDVIAIAPNLRPLPATAVRARVGSAQPASTSCGTRCYRFPLTVLAGRPVRLVATVNGRPVRFALPARLPPDASGRLRAATRQMARVRSVRVDETLSSGVAAIRARFALAAPDRMRYTTSGGQQAVVIGNSRWDRLGGSWKRTEYQRIRQPAYMWQGARFARRVGTSRLAGQRVDVIAAFRPDDDYPAWFRLYLTRGGRIVRGEMTAPAHFMVDRLSDFNRAGPIEPPTSG